MGLDISECRFMNLIIIVPCYNESKRLEPSAFEGFMKIHPELSYLFVNDGSKDQTLSILKKMENHFIYARNIDFDFISTNYDWCFFCTSW